MEIRSNETMLEKILGENMDIFAVFQAEKIIINYIGKKPENWDDGLTLATAKIVERMALDTGIKSESVDTHSVVFRDIKTLEDFLGASVVALLDGYKSEPAVPAGFSGIFGYL